MSKTTTRLPPSPLRRFEFRDGEIQVLARYAKLIEGDPDRLFLFSAHEVGIGEGEVYPPAIHDDDSEWSSLRAFYAAEDFNTILYFLEAWANEAVTDFAACHLIIELHELSHWAHPAEGYHDDTEHWGRWNRVLRDVVDYVMDIDEWDVSEYNPPPQKTGDSGDSGTQVTFEDLSHIQRRDEDG